VTYSRFAVRAELASPIIVLGWLTLDGLLAAQLFQQTQSIERAHAEIPLARTGDLWHASAAFFEDATPTGAAFTASLRAQNDLRPEDIGLMRGGKLPKPGLKRRREWGNVMNSYPALNASAVWWFGEGDANAVEQLLHEIGDIGKARARGFGHVVQVDIADAMPTGVKGTDGQPLRPVPLDLWTGAADAVRSEEAWRPAYWKRENRTVCVVPETVEKSRDDLEAWLA
jgi:hypothetical protein